MELCESFPHLEPHAKLSHAVSDPFVSVNRDFSSGSQADRLIGPVAMGWGVTRHRVYILLLRLTCQTFVGKDSSNGKPVGKVSCLEVAIKLTIASARARAYHSVESRDDQTSRRYGSRQSHTWSSVRKRISGPHGKIDFHDPSRKTDISV